MEFNLADLWEYVVDTIPEHEAVVCDQRRLTYADLEARSNRLAHHLAHTGIGPGDHIALYLYNGIEYLEAMIAAWKIRAVPINVNYRYGPDELRYLLADADARAAIFHRELVDRVDAVRAQLALLREFIVVDDDSVQPVFDGVEEYERALARQSAARDFGPRSPDDLYILYTGGTTGMPKGVVWRVEDAFFGAFGGGNLGGPAIANVDELVEHLDVRRRVLPACPFMHGTAHWMAFATFYAGGTVVVTPDRHFDAVRLWQLIARERVSFLVIVGDAFARPLVEALDRLDPLLDISSLTAVLSGGAVLSPSVKTAWVERLPGTVLIDGFGASETGGQGQSLAAAGSTVEPATHFLMNAETAVLGDDLRPVEPGHVGRIARRGHVPLGYYNDPEKTAATFPMIDGLRWSVPGDHARLEPDGTITVLGRGSLSINTGGEKVYPDEVEAALKSHPTVFDAVVVGVPDARFGERVAAVVQFRPGQSASTDDLAAHTHLHLAGYKAPRVVVPVERVVRFPSGKPDYRWARRVAEGHTASP